MTERLREGECCPYGGLYGLHSVWCNPKHRKPLSRNDAEKDAKDASNSVAPEPEKEPSADSSGPQGKGMETPTPD